MDIQKLTVTKILSIASTYGFLRAQDAEELYTLLQNCETLETDNITSRLHLMQDQKRLEVEKEAAMLHIREDNNSGLKIYLPKDEVNQEVCYSSKLPRRLCEWLTTYPDTQIHDSIPVGAITVVQSVLGARNVAVPAILDEYGILPVGFPEVEQEDIVVEVAQSSSSLSTSYSPYWSGTSSASRASSTTRPSRGSTPQPPRESSYDSAHTGYTRLLRKVVEIAGETAFPSEGIFDMSGMQAALDIDEPERGGDGDSDEEEEDLYHLRSTNKLERNKKVGAAGQLFVSFTADRPISLRPGAHLLSML